MHARARRHGVGACEAMGHERERTDLVAALREAGPGAATLCEGWSTEHLAAHVVLRESSPLTGAGLVLDETQCQVVALPVAVVAVLLDSHGRFRALFLLEDEKQGKC